MCVSPGALVALYPSLPHIQRVIRAVNRRCWAMPCLLACTAALHQPNNAAAASASAAYCMAVQSSNPSKRRPASSHYSAHPSLLDGPYVQQSPQIEQDHCSSSVPPARTCILPSSVHSPSTPTYLPGTTIKAVRPFLRPRPRPVPSPMADTPPMANTPTSAITPA